MTEYTIFRSERVLRGGKPEIFVSRMTGFGANAHDALCSCMDDVAENECDHLQDMDTCNPDYEFELSRAAENLPGKWDVYAGRHETRPAGAPQDSLGVL